MCISVYYANNVFRIASQLTFKFYIKKHNIKNVMIAKFSTINFYLKFRFLFELYFHYFHNCVTPRKQYQLLLCSPHPLKMSRLFHLFVQNMIWPAVESLTQYFTVLENFYFAKWLIIHESYVVLHSDWTIMITHLLHANCILVRWLPILFLCWQAFDGSCFKTGTGTCTLVFLSLTLAPDWYAFHACEWSIVIPDHI